MPYKNKPPRIYNIYSGIKARCKNKNHHSYNNYGGRGIKCKWSSFSEFVDDMGVEYLNHVKKFGEKQTVIDRINNDGHYEKKNCRWVTYSENNLNSSRAISKKVCQVCIELKPYREKGMGWRTITKATGMSPSKIIYHITGHKKYAK